MDKPRLLPGCTRAWRLSSGVIVGVRGKLNNNRWLYECRLVSERLALPVHSRHEGIHWERYAVAVVQNPHFGILGHQAIYWLTAREFDPGYSYWSARLSMALIPHYKRGDSDALSRVPRVVGSGFTHTLDSVNFEHTAKQAAGQKLSAELEQQIKDGTEGIGQAYLEKYERAWQATARRYVRGYWYYWLNKFGQLAAVST